MFIDTTSGADDGLASRSLEFVAPPTLGATKAAACGVAGCSPGVQVGATGGRYFHPVLMANGTPHGASAPRSGDDLDHEKERLERELAEARAELLAAKARLSDREAAVRAAVREELESAQRTLADLDRRHAESIVMIRSAAQSEAERIVADAADRGSIDGGTADDER